MRSAQFTPLQASDRVYLITSFLLQICSVCYKQSCEFTICTKCNFVYTCPKNHFPENHEKWCSTLSVYQETKRSPIDSNPYFGNLETDGAKNMTDIFKYKGRNRYTLSEAWSGVNRADLMAARAPLGPIFMTGLSSVQSIVPTTVLVDLS